MTAVTGLNPTITTSSVDFQSGYSMWNNYLNLWPNLTMVLGGHSIYQSWHVAGSWLFKQVPLTSASTRGQTVQGLFVNWQEADAGNYSGVLPGDGGNVGPGTYCGGVPQGSIGARIGHVMLLHFRPSAGKLDGYSLSTNIELWEQAYANRAVVPASTPQLLFSVDYAGVPEKLWLRRLWFSQISIWLIQWELRTFRKFPPTAVLSALLASMLSVFRSRAALQLEIIALRHQLGVLQRSVKRPKLNRFDRFLWAWFCGIWDIAVRTVPRQTRHRHRVAPQRISTVLDLESSPRPARPPTCVEGNS
jgi:hypothetical protein